MFVSGYQNGGAGGLTGKLGSNTGSSWNGENELILTSDWLTLVS